MMHDQSNDAEYNSENEEEMEDKIEDSRTQHSQDELKDPSPDSNAPRAVQPRVTRSLTNRTRIETRKSVPVVNVPCPPDKSVRKVEPVTNSHSAPMAFGRVLAPLFGASKKPSSVMQPGAAFLVLDHAERLFSLSTKQKMEPNNYLAQLLLLPKVVGLNLTIIIVSRSTLLDCARESRSVRKKC